MKVDIPLTFFLPGVTKRDCPTCGSEFIIHKSSQIYCSTRCRVRANRRKYPNGKPPEITRVGPAIADAASSSSPSSSLPLPMPHNEFSTIPSTAEDEILARWNKDKPNEE